MACDYIVIKCQEKQLEARLFKLIVSLTILEYS